MQFMMLMIPAVYQGGKKLDPGFVPDPKKIAEMTRFNEELGQACKILSLNGLHPVNTGARVSFSKGKTAVTDGPFIETKEVLGGYYIVDVKDLDRALELAGQLPGIRHELDSIEVRPLLDYMGS